MFTIYSPIPSIIEDQEKILFHCADITFELDSAAQVQQWLEQLATEESCQIEQLQYIFCSDEYLLDINKQYLDHDYYTDIITFPLNADQQALVSDIYISIDRIKDNAQAYKVSFEKELYRVIAHGLLHMCGYGDATDAEKEIMRGKEDYYVAKLIL